MGMLIYNMPLYGFAHISVLWDSLQFLHDHVIVWLNPYMVMSMFTNALIWHTTILLSHSSLACLLLLYPVGVMVLPEVVLADIDMQKFISAEHFSNWITPDGYTCVWPHFLIRWCFVSLSTFLFYDKLLIYSYLTLRKLLLFLINC